MFLFEPSNLCFGRILLQAAASMCPYHCSVRCRLLILQFNPTRLHSCVLWMLLPPTLVWSIIATHIKPQRNEIKNHFLLFLAFFLFRFFSVACFVIFN